MQKSREEINKARSGFNKRKITERAFAFYPPTKAHCDRKWILVDFREDEMMTIS